MGWNLKLLSQDGKQVLIKSVIQSLPTFATSCFRLLDHLLKDLDSAMGNFWEHCFAFNNQNATLTADRSITGTHLDHAIESEIEFGGGLKIQAKNGVFQECFGHNQTGGKIGDFTTAKPSQIGQTKCHIDD
ncbi:UNVERIFIED_CONTAM: hypothetical protein Sradi_0913000 [Sesamum radiatum]|uniref:Uncharacterized protein n=1 Tax=Sesamum radiatum TaxID=300843 RepID=A0AAW2V5T8_SESRA